jgi:cell division septation protein DedD
MTNENQLIQLMSCGNDAEATTLCSLLQANGIQAFVHNSSRLGAIGELGAGDNRRLLVAQHDVEHATEVLREAGAISESDDAPPAVDPKKKRALIIGAMVTLVVAVVVGALAAGDMKEQGKKAVMDCESTPACTASGSCTVTPKNTCTVGSDADCRQSEVCQNEGLCTAVAGMCRAGSTGDCQASKRCQTHGYCEWINGSCGK